VGTMGVDEKSADKKDEWYKKRRRGCMNAERIYPDRMNII